MDTQREYPEKENLQYDAGYLNGECRQLQEKNQRLTKELDTVRAENEELHYALGQSDTEKKKLELTDEEYLVLWSYAPDYYKQFFSLMY